MRPISFLVLILCSLYVHAQMASAPDSILKKVEGLKNVSAIQYLKDNYANGKPKSEGWAYLFQDEGRTKYVRLGHWQYFYKNGSLEFEDFLPVNDSMPIVQKYYDKEGVLVKEVYVAQEFDKNKNLTKSKYSEVHYYPSGKIKSRAHYKDNKKAHTWRWYDEAGNVTNEKVYSQEE